MAKTVAIKMDKARNIKFGINGMIKLEKELGKPLTELDEKNTTIEDLRSMLFVGLSWEDKELTHDAVGDLMDNSIEEHGFDYLFEKVGKAMESSFGNTAVPSKK